MTETDAALLAQRIMAKCEQYWNEPHIGAPEIHAALELIHRDARLWLALAERQAARIARLETIVHQLSGLSYGMLHVTEGPRPSSVSLELITTRDRYEVWQQGMTAAVLREDV